MRNPIIARSAQPVRSVLTAECPTSGILSSCRSLYPAGDREVLFVGGAQVVLAGDDSVGVAETPLGEAARAASPASPAHGKRDGERMWRENGAVAPAGSEASQLWSAAARPAGAESEDHGSSLSAQ